jgi:hypothetical protein
VEEEVEKSRFISDYFMSLFRSNGGRASQQILNAVEGKVTHEMNDFLMKPFLAEEVKEALDSIGDLKAPGPDGIPSLFYRRFWDLVGKQVTKEKLDVLNGGPMPREWNETRIVLILKVLKPELVKDLRPISLCNVLYKMMSKVLANRLKVILPKVISMAQSAFVPGRLISDNILVAYELTHCMKNKRRGKKGFAAVKLE